MAKGMLHQFSIGVLLAEMRISRGSKSDKIYNFPLTRAKKEPNSFLGEILHSNSDKYQKSYLNK